MNTFRGETNVEEPTEEHAAEDKNHHEIRVEETAQSPVAEEGLLGTIVRKKHGVADPRPPLVQ